MKTRQQYLDGECTMREYYAQFVNEGTKRIIRDTIGEDAILQSTDPHLNDIPLARWDSVGMSALRTADRNEQMRECGDYMTLAGLVCIAKEAARQIQDESRGAYGQEAQ